MTYFCNIDPYSLITSDCMTTKRCLTQLCRWALLYSREFYLLQCNRLPTSVVQTLTAVLWNRSPGNQEEFCNLDVGDSCVWKGIIVCYCSHGVCIQLHKCVCTHLSKHKSMNPGVNIEEELAHQFC